MALTIDRFFQRYIVDPQSYNLTFKERIVATALSALAALLLGIPHVVAYCIEKERIRLIRKINKHRCIAKEAANKIKKLNILPQSTDSVITQQEVQQCIALLTKNRSDCLSSEVSRVHISFLTIYTLYAQLSSNKLPHSYEEIALASLIAAALYVKTDTETIMEMIRKLGINRDKEIQKYRQLIKNVIGNSFDDEDSLSRSISCAIKIEQTDFDNDTKGKKILQSEIIKGCQGRANAKDINGILFQLIYLKKETMTLSSNTIDEITSYEFPFLYKALVLFGLKEDMSLAIKESAKKENQNQVIRESASLVKNELLDCISTKQLKRQILKLEKTEDRHYLGIFQAEISKRHSSLIAFKEAIRKGDFVPLCSAFEQLPPHLKSESCETFMEEVQLHPIAKDEFPLTAMQLKHHALQQLIKNCNNPKTLHKSCREFLLDYNSQKEMLPKSMQTTTALAYEKIFHLYSRKKFYTKALEVLKEAESAFQFEKSHPLFDFSQYENKLEFLQRGNEFLRNRTMRVSHQPTEHGNLLEVSIELTTHSRKRLQQNLKVLRLRKDISFKTVAGKYLMKYSDMFTKCDSLHLGTDLQISFDDLKDVEILLGNDIKYYNQHHRLRIRLPITATVEQLHKAFTRLGLPMALMPSRSEDIKREAFAKIIQLRFPHRMYAKSPHLSPQKVYQGLTENEREIVDKDLENCDILSVNKEQLEVVNPGIGKEAWQQGARAISASINGGDMTSTSSIIANIFKVGLLSAQERNDRGIKGKGNAPVFNCKVGSSNQVFTRILTKSFFSNFPLDKFAVCGSAVLLFDVQALERMPYSYYKDRGGLRNPYHRQAIFIPQNQAPELHFTGDRMKELMSLTRLIHRLNKKPNPTTETMFDGSLGSQYLRGILVRDEGDKRTLIKKLESQDIFQIAGHPLEKTVIVTDKLTSKIINSINFWAR